MSWKLFSQIVLLIIIAAILLSATNYGMLCMKKGVFKGKPAVQRTVK